MTKISICLLVCLGALAAAEAHKALGRHKRSYVDNPWPGFWIPYYFDSSITEWHKIKYRGIMRMIEKHTCLRFYEKATATSPHPDGSNSLAGYAYFDTITSCRVETIGYRSNAPNRISACTNKMIMLHEFGHLAGGAHDGRRYERDFLYNLQKENVGNSYMTHVEMETLSKQESYLECDISTSTPMVPGSHEYSEYGYPNRYGLFPNAPEPTYASLDNFFKEINIANHCCGTTSCEQTNIYNEGYQSNQTGTCTTVCPQGLEPSTNCLTSRTQTASASWPLPMVTLKLSSGCPASFLSSTLRMRGTGSNQFPTPSSLYGTQSAEEMELHFCTKSSGVSDPLDEPANYCLLPYNSNCPSGMHEANITIPEQEYSGTKFTDQSNFPNGQFNTDSTTLSFCCRRDGYSFSKLNLPVGEDFTLFKVHGEECTPVEGMSVTEEKAIFSMTGSLTTVYVTDSEAKPDFTANNNDLTIKYCKYQTIDYNCGGTIDLSASNTPATISSSYPNGVGTNKECNWVINAPADHRILVECSTPNVRAPDSLTYRKRVLNEIPVPVFQNSNGDMPPILSLYNKFMLTLKTGQTTNSGSGLSCTATLKSDADMPYSGVGEDYDGDMNYAVDEEGYHQCMPWSEVFNRNPELFVSEENPSAPHFAEYESNYCRNPNGNRLRPFCAISVFQRNVTLRYCDVLQHTPKFDKVTNCAAVLQADPSCASRETKRVCFKTCYDNNKINDYPTLETKVTCGSPSLPSGAVNGNAQSSYNPGEKITVSCDNSESTIQLMCLSSGQWSSFQNFCSGGCPSGFVFKNQMCLYFDDTRRTVSQARTFCADKNSHMMWATNSTELANLIGFRSDVLYPNAKIWMGAAYNSGWQYDVSGLSVTGTWLWKSGLSETSAPSNNALGARLRGAGTTSQPNKLEIAGKTTNKCKTICRAPDANGPQCLDVSSLCPSILEMNPQVKTTQMAAAYCAYTSGQCEASTCTVPTPATGVVASVSGSIPTGSTVQYHCAAGYTMAGGQGSPFRACKRDGTLTGQELVCTEKTQNRRQTAYYPLAEAPLATSQGDILGGPSLYMSAQVDSKVTACGAYCRADGTIKLQAWEIGSSPKDWILKSEREVTCLGGMANYWDFTTNWSVNGSQFFTVMDTTGAGVTYRSCQGTKTNYPAKFIRNIAAPGTIPAVETSYRFEDYPQCYVLSAICILVPDTYTGSGFDNTFYVQDDSELVIPGQ